MATTPDQFRQIIFNAIDSILNTALVHFVSADNKRLLRAQRFFWQQADEPTLQKALDIYNNEK